MALMVGLLSFAWFAWQIEGAREFEQKATPALAAAPGLSACGRGRGNGDASSYCS